MDTTSRFIRDGIEADEPVLVVVGAEKIALLREELGQDAGRVEFADMALVGSNPARIIPAWYDFVADRGAGGRAIRGIGEPISNERSPQSLVECQRHESLLNLAFDDSAPWWLLCPYDISVLGADIIEEAMRSHPSYLESGKHHPSASYVQLEAICEPFARPLPEPGTKAAEMHFGLAELGRVREAVARLAARNGLHHERVDDLTVAVNEIAINSVRHGGGAGCLRAWVEDGAIICEVADQGEIQNPLLGRVRPKPGQEGGFGMWLVHQLCDLVQIRSFGDGSVVRVHMALPGRA